MRRPRPAKARAAFSAPSACLRSSVRDRPACRSAGPIRTGAQNISKFPAMRPHPGASRRLAKSTDPADAIWADAIPARDGAASAISSAREPSMDSDGARRVEFCARVVVLESRHESRSYNQPIAVRAWLRASARARGAGRSYAASHLHPVQQRILRHAGSLRREALLRVPQGLTGRRDAAASTRALFFHYHYSLEFAPLTPNGAQRSA
jgi:hypothetical protein